MTALVEPLPPASPVITMSTFGQLPGIYRTDDKVGLFNI